MKTCTRYSIVHAPWPLLSLGSSSVPALGSPLPCASCGQLIPFTPAATGLGLTGARKLLAALFQPAFVLLFSPSLPFFFYIYLLASGPPFYSLLPMVWSYR